MVQLLEELPDGTVVVDAAGRIVYVNRELEALSEWSRHELVGRELEVLVPEERRGRHAELHAAYRAAPRPRAMAPGLDLQLRRADGATVDVEIGLASIDLDGEPFTVATVRNVTEKYAMQRHRSQLLEVLDLDPDGVYVVDAATGQIEYANHGAQAMVGSGAEELLARRLDDITAEPSRRAQQQLIEELHELPLGAWRSTVLERRTSDGRAVPVDALVRRTRTADGHDHYLVVERDARSRLREEARARRRAAVDALVVRITGMVLAGEALDAVYDLLVEETATLLESDNASLVLHDPVLDRFVTVAAVGPAARLHLTGAVALHPETVRAFAYADEPAAVPVVPAEMAEELRRAAGSGAVAPFPGRRPARGLLATFRAPGGEPFQPDDVALLGDLARQVGTVVELGLARADQARLAVLEERQRIARDLHDNVIQDIIRAGFQLAAAQRTTGDSRTRDLFDLVIDELDGAVRSLRAVVFDNRAPVTSGTASSLVRAILRDVSRVLGWAPSLAVVGPLDGLPREIVGHLLSVLREALSNVARHAGATSAEVTIEVSEERLSLIVDDNGRGPADGERVGTGLASMQERAELLRGTSTLSPRPGGGARLHWTALLRPEPH